MQNMQVNIDQLQILGQNPYVFFAGVGIVFSFLCFNLLLKRYGHDINKNNINYFISFAGLFIGAKLFGIFTNLIVAWNQGNVITMSTFLSSGIVFYGGLIGYLLFFIFVNKKQNKSVDYHVIDVVVVCIPLFHAFGRVGCFFSGCCYGREMDTPISIMYITARLEPSMRVPVQLLEATASLTIFVVCLTLLINRKLSGKVLSLYLLLYASVRFILEFLRGDIERGFIGILSFSQVISILVFGFLVIQIKMCKQREVIQI